MKWERLYQMWQSDRNNLPLTVELIDQQLKSGAIDECQSVIDSLAIEVRNGPEICAKNIELLFHQDKLVEACDKAQELCQQTQDHPIALHYLALSRYLTGRLDEVLALEQKPQLTPETHILLARAYYHQGDIDKALSIVKPIELPEALGLSAMLYLDSGQLEQCVQCADNVLAASDNQMDALLAKASYMVTMQQVAEAKPFIEKALSLQPNSGRALSVRGQIEMFATDIDTAIDTFKQAVAFMPDHIGTWHLLAWCYFLKNNFVEAKQAFDKAMLLDHNFGETHGGLAVLAAAEGDIASATSLAKKAMRLDPASFAGLYASSIIAERNGNLTEATEIIDGILAQSSHLAGRSNRDLVNAVITQRKSLH